VRMLNSSRARQPDAGGVLDTATNSGRGAQAEDGRAAIDGERATRTAHHCESTLAPRIRLGAGSVEACASALASVKKYVSTMDLG